jgi:hypothetical protein
MPAQKRAGLWQQACSNDETTINVWRTTWTKNIRENHKRFGSFKKRGIGQLYGRHQFLPAFVCGSGPSLAENGEALKKLDPRVPIVSCLHNFHWHIDKDVRADYFVTLDAGSVVLEEVAEGGEKTEEEYWKATEGKKLLAFIGSPPALLEKWRGEIFFFNCPIPDPALVAELDAIEKFHTYCSTGGNVLGASMYIAKAIFGCNPICFLGANFAFSYKNKFHGWDSKYDATIGNALRVRDVYGMPVNTWPSYNNFKAFFDHIAIAIPGVWINCTEGGTFGATEQGNIRQVIQMDLADCITMLQLNQPMQESCQNPEIEEKKILF